MYASEQDIRALRNLQALDLRVAAANKEFEELPHRQAILDVRSKKDGLLKKKVQVQDMLDKAEESLSTCMQEDEKLKIKQERIEKILSEVQGDYRAVSAHSRDLDGVFKRQGKIAFELVAAQEQVGKIKPVIQQLAQTLSMLETQEQELIESFQKKGQLA